MTLYKGNKALKADARESLLGHLTIAVFSVFLCMLTTSVIIEMITHFRSESQLIYLVLSCIVFFVVNTVSNMLRIGLAGIFLQLQYRRDTRIKDLFCAFRYNSDSAVIISGFIALLELACMLPSIVATSVSSATGNDSLRILIIVLTAAGALGTVLIRLRYALCSYLFLDYPQFSAGELIRGSTKLLRGNFGRLIKLYLSFIPLFFLGFLSFGVASLWVTSYYNAAQAAFYKDLMANLSSK